MRKSPAATILVVVAAACSHGFQLGGHALQAASRVRASMDAGREAAKLWPFSVERRSPCDASKRRHQRMQGSGESFNESASTASFVPAQPARATPASQCSEATRDPEPPVRSAGYRRWHLRTPKIISAEPYDLWNPTPLSSRTSAKDEQTDPEGDDADHTQATLDALARLAAALAPHKIVVECGSGGTCGPNSLARVLAQARVHDGSGDDVRSRVMAHAAALVRADAAWEPDPEGADAGRSAVSCGSVGKRSVRTLIENSFAAWARPDQEISAEGWLTHMAEPTSWIDLAFLALAADCFAVEITNYEARVKGGAVTPHVVRPRPAVDVVLARVELAYVVGKHFCAMLPSEEESVPGTVPVPVFKEGGPYAIDRVGW